MKHILLFLLLHIGIFSSAFSQTEKLTLIPNCKNRFNAKQGRCIDNRGDKSNIGFVYTIIRNKINWLVYEGNLMDGIGSFFFDKKQTKHDCKDLVIVVNEFFVSEIIGGKREYGSLRLDLRFFVASELDKYHEMYIIHGVLPGEGDDVTKRILKSASVELCSISEKLRNDMQQDFSNKPVYSLADLHAIDSIEKSKMPIFVTDLPKAGVFYSFESFKANTPDTSSQLRIDDKGKNYSIVYTLEGTKRKPKRLFVDNIYAVSNGSHVFIATKQGFIKAEKRKLDYYVARPSENETDHIAVSMGYMFGINGSLFSRNNTKDLGGGLQYKIHHVNGGLILAK